MSFIFLPGVIIHELSHLLIAVILFVPVGDMEFTPKKGEERLKLGSVEIAKTDPVRRSIIGFAPVFVGLMLVVGIVYLFTSNILFFKEKEIYVLLVSVLAIIYFLFVISNTMFSSKVDMEGTLEILITLVIIFLASYILGLRFSLTYLDKIFTKELIGMVQKSTIFMLVPIVIDLFILGTIRILTNSRSRTW